MIRKHLFLTAAILAMPFSVEAQSLNTHIKGEISDTTARIIVMNRVGVDTRTGRADTIPFRNGRFAYDLLTDGIEAMEVTAYNDRGSGSYVEFFAEGDTVSITFPADGRATWHATTPRNTELTKVKQRVDDIIMKPLRERERMEREGRDVTPEGKALKDRIIAAKTERNDSLVRVLANEAQALIKKGMLYTAEYSATEKSIDEAFHASFKYEMDYAQANPGHVGLLCLYNVSRKAKAGSKEGLEICDIYNDVYDGKLSDFHLSEYMSAWCVSQQTRVGGRYYDFTAPDLYGKQHTLSEEIKGKIALIDLWASWCGPCRRLSRSMIPVYEEYKDKGFTIVGVAREKKADDMRTAIRRDKYPWLNLLELNDRAKIWQHYGVGYSGGSTFLVDKDGKILAISPSAEEVRAILEKKGVRVVE